MLLTTTLMSLVVCDFALEIYINIDIFVGSIRPCFQQSSNTGTIRLQDAVPVTDQPLLWPFGFSHRPYGYPSRSGHQRETNRNAAT